jgi:glucose/arabinose dehydrogenase
MLLIQARFARWVLGVARACCAGSGGGVTVGRMFEPLEARQMLSNLPSGLGETQITGDIDSPTAFVASPDGKLYISQKPGRLLVVDADGQTLSADFFDGSLLSRIDISGERGLLGVAFDPNFASNRRVYAYYTAEPAGEKPTRNVLSRFLADSEGTLVQSGSETILLENNLTGATNHNGGALAFGPDGKLYVAIGDNANPQQAQQISSLNGKILRLNTDGSAPSDNPFVSTNGARPEIWALGLRNPFTFAFDPESGRFHINDVGQGDWEEINLGASGANYGWPDTEGDFNPAAQGNSGFTRPLYAYPHGSDDLEGFAIAGGVFYSPDTLQLGSSYQHDYFFADFVTGFIATRDATTGDVQTFATDVGNVVDMEVQPDGSLLYLSRGGGSAGAGLYRVRTSANLQPSIALQPSNTLVSTAGSATLTSLGSGPGPLRYQWQKQQGEQFVDLRSSTRLRGTRSPDLTFKKPALAAAGVYRVLITNNAGSVTSNTVTVTVTAERPPRVTFSYAPGASSRTKKYVAGQAVNFTASAIDPQASAPNNTLDATHFAWTVEYLTSIKTGSPVVRPFAEFDDTKTGSFTPADALPTYSKTDVAYRLTLVVTDDSGLSTSRSVDIKPQLARLTIGSNVRGSTLVLDELPLVLPRKSVTFSSVVGLKRSLSATESITVSGDAYNFTGWSDDGADDRIIVAIAGRSQRFTALYLPVPV